MTFDHVTNDATVTGTGRVGGIVGTLTGSFKGDNTANNEIKVVMSNAVNKKMITTTGLRIQELLMQVV